MIRTDLPNGSYSRVEFDAWSQTLWDPNDTIGEPGNAWFVARQPGSTATPEEKRAAQLARLRHAPAPDAERRREEHNSKAAHGRPHRENLER